MTFVDYAFSFASTSSAPEAAATAFHSNILPPIFRSHKVIKSMFVQRAHQRDTWMKRLMKASQVRNGKQL